MEASQAMADWAGNGHQPFAPRSQARGDQSLEERFDTEAMPHLNGLFRTALRMTGERVYKILFHCVSHQRRKWFRYPLLKENEEFLEANLVQPETVAQEIRDGEILAALNKIPSEFRSVVLLVDVEEFTYKEVAEILSIPIGTVMSRLSRGRGLLRKNLAEVARMYGIGKSLQKDNRL